MILKNHEFYKLLARATVIITTISPRGIPNAAPFSFNMPVSFHPPIFGFACDPEHDTWRNIKETGEFVVNIIDESLGDKLHILEKDFPYEVNEIKEANLTEVKSKKVKPPRILEAIAWLECRTVATYPVGDHMFIAGEVLLVEVKDEYYKRKLDLNRAKLLIHISGTQFAIPLERTFKRAR